MSNFDRKRPSTRNEFLIDFTKIKVDTLPELEQLMLHKLYNLNESFMKHFNSYNIHLIYKEYTSYTDEGKLVHTGVTLTTSSNSNGNGN